MSIDVFLTRTASFLPLEPVGNDEMEAVLGMVGGKPSKARRIVLPNLVPGTVYTIQARVIGGSTGQSDWSTPVSIMAT